MLDGLKYKFLFKGTLFWFISRAARSQARPYTPLFWLGLSGICSGKDAVSVVLMSLGLEFLFLEGRMLQVVLSGETNNPNGWWFPPFDTPS